MRPGTPDTPAYPHFITIKDEYSYSKGITKREYFIAAAMQGIMANPESISKCINVPMEACRVADEVLFYMDRMENARLDAIEKAAAGSVKLDFNGMLKK